MYLTENSRQFYVKVKPHSYMVRPFCHHHAMTCIWLHVLLHSSCEYFYSKSIKFVLAIFVLYLAASKKIPEFAGIIHRPCCIRMEFLLCSKCTAFVNISYLECWRPTKRNTKGAFPV